MNKEIAWPPPYIVRKSERSKRISLRVHYSKGLEIVIPKRETLQNALAFLDKNYQWVVKQLQLIAIKPEISIICPQTINLPISNEQWSVQYTHKYTSRLKEDKATCTLFLNVNLNTHEKILLIKKWLIRKAKLILPNLLTQYQQETQFQYHQVSIRWQKTRWGSCSINKAISLNAKLLLLPNEIIRYILIHELVHTVHFDHSAKFWQAVAKFVPNHLELRKQLKIIEKSQPDCVY